MSAIREPGFYWVRFSGWTVAQYCSADEADWWLLPGLPAHFRTSDFDEIGPRVEPPR